MVSIIIPFHNCSEYTKECIQSIEECTQDYELILIDNGSKNEPEFIDHLMKIKSLGKFIINDENLGFPKAINQGVAQAKGDVICILNNDIITTPGWLDTLVGHLEKTDIVGPCTNWIDGPQLVLLDEIYNTKEELYKGACAFHSLNKGILWRWHRLVGFCLVMKKELFTNLGGFNEIFSPGNYEDDALCLKAIENGYTCSIARDVYLHHFGSVTHYLLGGFEQLLKKNKKTFDSIWSKEKIKKMEKKNNGVKNGKK